MQFIDEAEVFVKAGDGGAGAVAFRREKFVPRGGPAGGDGGDGADIVLETDERLTTLLDFRFKREYRAKNGEPGRGRDQNGHAAKELLLKVPPGTIVKDAETGATVKDLRENGVRYVLAKGGRGGLGNMNFATPTLQAPRFAQPGTPGEEKRVKLELRLLADVGLVGFPNAGKSTLVARLSRARPKIADYPFTTLQPHLGVVQYKDERSFVLSDLPGLIEGAHEGAGLGHRFLKHMQRCRAIIHLVDASSHAISGRDLLADYDAINRELSLFDPALGRKAQVVAANKVDVSEAREAAAEFAEALRERGIVVHLISGATGEGIQGLLDAAVRELDHAGTAPLLERDLTDAQPYPRPAPGGSLDARRPQPAAEESGQPPEALTEADLEENAREPQASSAQLDEEEHARLGQLDSDGPEDDSADASVDGVDSMAADDSASGDPAAAETTAATAAASRPRPHSPRKRAPPERKLSDDREEAGREKALRAPMLTGRGKDGVFKAKAKRLEAQGTAPHQSRAGKTRAAVKALSAVAQKPATRAAKAVAAKPVAAKPVAPKAAESKAVAKSAATKAAAARKPVGRAKSAGAALAQAAATKRATKGATKLATGAVPARGKKA